MTIHVFLSLYLLSPHPAAPRRVEQHLALAGYRNLVASGIRAAVASFIFLLLMSGLVGLAPAATPGGKPANNPANAAVAIATILDGDAFLLRGTSQFMLAEGTRLYADDILETGVNSRLVQLEFADGTRLSLGPATRVQVMPQLGAARAKTTPHAYLLQGSLKLRTATKATSTPGTVVASPWLDLEAASASAVLLVQANSTRLFAETGDLGLLGWRASAPPSNTLKSGELLSWSANAKPLLTSRAPSEFVQSLPKAFLDNLPARAALFSAPERQVVLTRVGEPAYALLQPWLDAEPALRKANLPRWKPLAAKPDFRQALRANLGAHPEWGPVLDPPKPKMPPPAANPPVPTAPSKTP